MPLSSGSTFGPYSILGPLGAGGMGAVYRARDAKLSREIAIKVLPDEVAGNHDGLARFELEARSASQLNHPNIITIYEVGGTRPRRTSPWSSSTAEACATCWTTESPLGRCRHAPDRSDLHQRRRAVVCLLVRANGRRPVRG